MRRIKLDTDTTNKLYVSLEANMSSLRKRSVSYTISAASNDLAVIVLTVTGKKGKMSLDFICKYDTFKGWEIYSSGYKWKLTALSEIQSVLKSEINRLGSLINKF